MALSPHRTSRQYTHPTVAAHFNVSSNDHERTPPNNNDQSPAPALKTLKPPPPPPVPRSRDSPRPSSRRSSWWTATRRTRAVSVATWGRRSTGSRRTEACARRRTTRTPASGPRSRPAPLPAPPSMALRWVVGVLLSFVRDRARVLLNNQFYFHYCCRTFINRGLTIPCCSVLCRKLVS